MISIDPATFVGLGIVIAAVATAAVTIMSGFAKMKADLAAVQKGVAEVHVAVNSGASELKAANERAANEAVRMAFEKAAEAQRAITASTTEAYAKGKAEGKLEVLREAGIIGQRGTGAAAPAASSLVIPEHPHADPIPVAIVSIPMTDKPVQVGEISVGGKPPG